MPNSLIGNLTASLDSSIPKLTFSGGTRYDHNFEIKVDDQYVKTAFFWIYRPAGTVTGDQWNISKDILNRDVLNGHTLNELQRLCTLKSIHIIVRPHHSTEELPDDLPMSCLEQSPNCPNIVIHQEALPQGDPPCRADGYRHVKLYADVPGSTPWFYEWYKDGTIFQARQSITSSNRRAVLDQWVPAGSSTSIIFTLCLFNFDVFDCKTVITVSIDICDQPSPPPCPSGFAIERIEVLDITGRDRTNDNCLPATDSNHPYSLKLIWSGNRSAPNLLPSGTYYWFKDGSSSPENSLTGQNPTFVHDGFQHTYKVRYILDSNSICDHSKEVVLQPCSTPVDCVVSDWSDWSDCVNNRITRTRTIITPPSNGGRPCPELSQSTPCHTPIDCVVSDWSDWSDCVNGRKTRTRTIITPPSNGGRPCPELSQSEACIRFSICLVAKILMMIGLALFFVGWILALCPLFSGLDPRINYGIAIALIFTGAVTFLCGFILWLIFCKPTPCDWMVLLWQVLFIGGYAFIFCSFCAACSPYILPGIILLGLAIGVYLWWEFTCKPSKCRRLIEFMVMVQFGLFVESILESGFGFSPGGCVQANLFAIIWGGIPAALSGLIWWQLSKNDCIKE